ncbi:MAG: glycosyltransferase family 2 protein [Mobilitalea sp.]
MEDKDTIMPSISIVMVSYNQGKYIEESILSIINQKYYNLEFIIVDGGSTDETLEIIDKYSEHINILCTEPDKGMYHARNKGIFLAKNDYIGFLNTDDILYPNALHTISEKIRSSISADMIFGYTIGLDKEGKEIDKIIFGKDINYDSKAYFKTMKTIPDQSTFYKRSTLSYIGVYDTSLSFGADTDLKCRFIKNKLEIDFVPKIIAGWRIYNDSLTYRPDLKTKRFKEAIKVNYKYTRKIINYYTLRLFVYNYILPGIKILFRYKNK